MTMQPTDILLLTALIIVILMSAFFSGTETGLISLNRVLLRQKEDEEDRRAIILGRLLKKPEQVLATILFGNNLVNVTATMIFLVWAMRTWGLTRAEFLTPLVLTPIILIFGEILPKSIFRHKADSLSLLFARPLLTVMVICAPIVFVLRKATGKLNSFIGGEQKRSPFITREDLRILFIEGGEHGVIEAEEREMIKGVIDFGTATVREIFVPRIDMVVVRDDATWDEVFDLFEEHGHSRLPVYHEKIDDIIGIIYLFDIMRAGVPLESSSIKDFIRPVTFIPESKKIHDLLHELREKQMFMAIVVDEYGGTAGLVTLEDIIEEIFGEIHDEYDVERAPVTNLGEGIFVLDARMHRDDAEELLGVRLPEGEYETVGGFVFEQLRRIPKKGESFHYNGFEVTILEATERAIIRVRFRRTPNDER
ncbi:MAG: hemolysin family protein [Candidatus Abyssubacteria bacterium]